MLTLFVCLEWFSCWKMILRLSLLPPQNKFSSRIALIVPSGIYLPTFWDHLSCLCWKTWYPEVEAATNMFHLLSVTWKMPNYIYICFIRIGLVECMTNRRPLKRVLRPDLWISVAPPELPRASCQINKLPEEPLKRNLHHTSPQHYTWLLWCFHLSS